MKKYAKAKKDSQQMLVKNLKTGSYADNSSTNLVV
jgi:hypothetical protein